MNIETCNVNRNSLRGIEQAEKKSDLLHSGMFKALFFDLWTLWLLFVDIIFQY